MIATTMRAALRAMARRARGRHDYHRLLDAPEYILRDIGVTRDDLRLRVYERKTMR